MKGKEAETERRALGTVPVVGNVSKYAPTSCMAAPAMPLARVSTESKAALARTPTLPQNLTRTHFAADIAAVARAAQM